MRTATTDTPRIYVASLTDYNNGILHGAWIDADQDAEAITEQVQAMLASSPTAAKYPQDGPAEKWAIHDHEGFPKGTISEWTSFELVASFAAFLEEHGDAGRAALSLASGKGQALLDEAERYMEEYIGEYTSPEDYAYGMAEDCYDLEKIPAFLRGHINWKAVAEDLRVSDDFREENGHYFRGGW